MSWEFQKVGIVPNDQRFVCVWFNDNEWHRGFYSHFTEKWFYSDGTPIEPNSLTHWKDIKPPE